MEGYGAELGGVGEEVRLANFSKALFFFSLSGSIDGGGGEGMCHRRRRRRRSEGVRQWVY